MFLFLFPLTFRQNIIPWLHCHSHEIGNSENSGFVTKGTEERHRKKRTIRKRSPQQITYLKFLI